MGEKLQTLGYEGENPLGDEIMDINGDGTFTIDSTEK